MGSLVQAQIKGLETNPNVLSDVEPGSLAQADNCIIVAPGLLAPRPGFDAYAGSFGVSADRAASVARFSAGYVLLYGTTLSHSVSGAAFSAYAGTFAPVDTAQARLRLVNAAQNLYANTATGTYVTSAIGDNPVLGGAPTPLAGLGLAVLGGSTQPFNSACAYRATLVRKDATSHIIESAPCGRFTVTNLITAQVGGLVRSGSTVTVVVPEGTVQKVGASFLLSPGETNFPAGLKTIIGVSGLSFSYSESGTAGASTAVQQLQGGADYFVQVILPAAATTSHWLRLYRSDATSTATDTPSDDMFMVLEQQLQAADLSARVVNLTDSQPEDLLGDPLYTSPNYGQGILATHQPLPVALDMTFWPSQGRLLWGNTKGKQQLSLQLLGVGGTTGLQLGDTVTVAGLTLIATTTGAGPDEFQLFSAGTPSQNVSSTVYSLIFAVFLNGGPAGYYESSDTDAPGKLMFEELGIGGAAFTAYSSRGTAWNPQLPTTAPGTASDNNALPDGIWYSDIGAPEHVQLISYLEVGDKSEAVLRLAPLLQSLIVFKTDGIYQLTGISPPFIVSKLSEARLLATDTVENLAESILALTDQGVVRVSQSGNVSVLTRASIDDQLAVLQSNSLLADVRKLSFAVADEPRRLYLLWVPSKAGLSAPDTCFCFNGTTQDWTAWARPASCGFMDRTAAALVLGRTDTNLLALERRNLDSSDVCDESYAVVIASATGQTVVLSGLVSVVVGDRLQQGSTVQLVTAVAQDSAALTTTLTLLAVETWTAGAAKVNPAFPCTIVWNPATAGNPAYGKQWGALSLLFQTCELHNATLMTVSEQQQASAVQPLVFPDSLGTISFGAGLLGGSQTKVLRISSLGTKTGSQLVVGLSIREAQSRFLLQGFTLEAEVIGEKGARR